MPYLAASIGADLAWAGGQLTRLGLTSVRDQTIKVRYLGRSADIHLTPGRTAVLDGMLKPVA